MSVMPPIHLTRGAAGCRLAVREEAISIVVDALRASTTIAALFDHGVERVLVIAEVEDTLALAAELPGALLVGERGSERLPGFDLGNSPLEVISSPRMEGQTALFTSSNGAQRLAASCGSDRVLAASVANATAVTDWTRRYALESGRPVVFVAAGKYPDESFVSPEDEAASAYLASRLGLPIAEDSVADYSYWERALVLNGLTDIFRGSRHAQRLMEIGYSEDVFFCARPDLFTSIPVVTDTVFLGERQVGVELRNLNKRA
ncbi:MAG: 2-phosphosulfolactate phosphatase [Armatimonadota bacterium]